MPEASALRCVLLAAIAPVLPGAWTVAAGVPPDGVVRQASGVDNNRSDDIHERLRAELVAAGGDLRVRREIASTYYLRLLALSEGGDVRATRLCIEHFRIGLADRGLAEREPAGDGAADGTAADGTAAERVATREHSVGRRERPLEVEEREALAALHRRWAEQHVDAGADERAAYLTHLESKGVAELGEARARDLAVELERRTLDPELAAAAMLARARMYAARLAQDAERQRAARAILRALAARYANTRAAALAAEEEWLLDNMSVGRVPPDFVTFDAAGNQIRLSDYRGQVVVVRFWQDWDEASDLRLVEEAALVERLWDERFTWIGVHTGLGRQAFLRRCQQRDVFWTQAWERRLDGASARAWHVAARPATYVLDAKGVLRGIDLAGDALQRLVGELIAELHESTLSREALLVDPTHPGPPTGR